MSRLSGISVSTTWDPASIGDDAEAEVDVTVPGAKLGDMAFVSLEVDTQDLVISAAVTAANTVTVVLANTGGSARDLASHTVNVKVVPKDAFFN